MHTPLLIVQRKVTLLPTVRPVMPLVLDVEVVMIVPFAAPTIVHKPELIVGALPAKVNAPELHCSWAAPAMETVGV